MMCTSDSGTVPNKMAATRSKNLGAHPKYTEMVAQAIASLKQRRGSSRQAILKYITKTFNVKKSANTHLKLALCAGVKNDTLIQCTGSGANGSFKLGDTKNKQGAVKTKQITKKQLKPTNLKALAKHNTYKQRAAAAVNTSLKKSKVKTEMTKKTSKALNLKAAAKRRAPRTPKVSKGSQKMSQKATKANKQRIGKMEKTHKSSNKDVTKKDMKMKVGKAKEKKGASKKKSPPAQHKPHKAGSSMAMAPSGEAGRDIVAVIPKPRISIFGPN